MTALTCGEPVAAKLCEPEIQVCEPVTKYAHVVNVRACVMNICELVENCVNCMFMFGCVVVIACANMVAVFIDGERLLTVAEHFQ